MLMHFSGHLLFCHLKHVLHGVQTDDAFDSILRELCAYPVRLLIFRLDALALSVIATATWLGGWVAGWVAVTLRYCIKTAKPVGKLFRPSESPIILVF